MSKYTAELREIIDLGFNIFDFEYNRTAESKAVVSDEDLQNGFIEHYYFREVGFETLERFKHKLKTQWKESLGELDSLLVAYNEKIDVKSNRGSSRNSTINFNGSSTNNFNGNITNEVSGNSSKNIENNSTENATTESEMNSSLSSNKNSKLVENDTPKSSLDFSLESGHASKIVGGNDTQNDESDSSSSSTSSNTKENNTSETNTESSTSTNTEETTTTNTEETSTTNNEQNKGYEGITEIELLELYHDKIKDIQTEFYISFDNLFMQVF